MKFTEKMKGLWSSLRDFNTRFCEKTKKFAYRVPVCHFLLSIILTFIVECLVRDSVGKAARFMFTKPHLFLFNVLIMFITYTFTLLLKKRLPATILVSLMWLLFGITDYIEGQFRVTPFNAMDLALIFSVKSIFLKYLSLKELILIITAIVLALILIVLLFIKGKKAVVDFKVAAITIATTIALIFVSSVTFTGMGILPEKFESLGTAYSNYGFSYCFTVGIFDRGIKKPKDYSKDKIDQIKDTDPPETTDQNPPEDTQTPPEQVVDPQISKPNVIFLQLESFLDSSEFVNLQFTENPTPNFSALKEKYPHGHLYVPSVGTGTVNTEFEILTGINIKLFGTAEYPYQTILRSTTCESLAFNLKENGYSAHAVHNYNGTFYNRNEVFSNLGFDSFTSGEYMQNLEYTPRGWEKDAILADYIMKCLDSTENEDFVYGITVQAHGRYPTKKPKGELVIDLTGAESQEEYWTYRYYADQLRQTDALIGDLIARIEERGEPTMIVMFGDHIPNIEYLAASDLATGDTYQTEYVIWDNFREEVEPQTVDLQAFQLSANVMSILGYKNGLFTSLHQRFGNTVTEEHEKELGLLAYDVLYGDRYAYEGNKDRYTPTELNMGIDPIEIIDVDYLEGRLVLSCTGITPMTEVRINGRTMESKIISDNTLLITEEMTVGETYTIGLYQIEESGDVLSREFEEAFTIE